MLTLLLSVIRESTHLPVFSVCLTWWCSSKPDAPDLLQSSRQFPAITRLEACSRLTAHHMDPPDTLGHWNLEYRWLMRSSWLGTDRFGGKSHWRDATADCFAPWWWWWWWWLGAIGGVMVTLRLWNEKSFFIVANQEVWGRLASLFQLLRGTPVRILASGQSVACHPLTFAVLLALQWETACHN